MHDYKFDWNQVYSILDHINELRKSLNKSIESYDTHDTHTPKSQNNVQNKSKHNSKVSNKLNHAKSTANRLTKSALNSIDAMNYISASEKRSIATKIKHLNIHNQAVLQKLNNNYKISNLLQITKLQLKKIIAVKHLRNIINLITLRVKKSSLKSKQQKAALAEIKKINKQTTSNLIIIQNVSDVKKAVNNCIKSINKSLVKYLIESRIQSINYLNNCSDKINDQISESHVNRVIKNHAHQAIQMIKTNGVAHLMSRTNYKFKKIVLLQNQYIRNLKNIPTSVNNLEKFNKFINKLNQSLAVSPLFVDTKFILKKKINGYQDNIVRNFQLNKKSFNTQDMNKHEHQVAITIILNVTKRYRSWVDMQSIDLTNDQKDLLKKRIQHKNKQIINNIKQYKNSQSIIKYLVVCLKRLKAIFAQSKRLGYCNQIDHLMRDSKVRIDRSNDLSSVDKHYLSVLVNNFGNKSKDSQDIQDVEHIGKALQDLLHKEISNLRNHNLSCRFNHLKDQISVSYLSDVHKQNLQKRIEKIESNKGFDFSSKLLFSQSINNYINVLTKKERVNHITKVSHRLIYLINPNNELILQQKFEEIILKFNHKLPSITDVVKLNHCEQIYENKLYKNWYKLSVDDDKLRKRMLIPVANLAVSMHNSVNLAILDTNLNQQMNDAIDQNVNSCLYSARQGLDDNKIKSRITEFKRALQKQRVKNLDVVKKQYAEQIKQSYRNMQSWLVVYPSLRSSLGKISLVRSRSLMRMDNFRDLLHLEKVRQISREEFNQIIDPVVDSDSSTKLVIRKRINQMINQFKLELNTHDSISPKVQLALLNRIKLVKNQSDICINQDSDDKAKTEIQHCHKSLKLILRRGYMQLWFNLIKHAQIITHRLSKAPVKSRQHVFNVLSIIRNRISIELSVEKTTGLYRVFHANQKRIQHVMQKAVYTDPVKSKYIGKLNKLTTNVQSYAKVNIKGRPRGVFIKKLINIKLQVQSKIIECSDKDCSLVYSNGKKQINGLELKVTQSIKLDQFGLYVQILEKKSYKLNFLAQAEDSKFNQLFNRCYHESIYNIQHSSYTQQCVKNERNSEKQIVKIFNRANYINNAKRNVYMMINKKINNAKHQIKNLKYVINKDKKRSCELLEKIQTSALKGIKDTSDHKEVSMIRNTNLLMVRQIISEVTSASALLSAVKNASNSINQSNLDKNQKNVTVRRIHQIFATGIKHQKGKTYQDVLRKYLKNKSRQKDNKDVKENNHSTDNKSVKSLNEALKKLNDAM